MSCKNKVLEEVLKPEQILYFMTQCFHKANLETKKVFKKKIEGAIILYSSENIDFIKDVFIAWACLHNNSLHRPAEIASSATPDIKEHFVDNGSDIFSRIATSIQCGNTDVKDLAFARFIFCKRAGAQYVSFNRAPDNFLVTLTHLRLAANLLKRFSSDCTFRASGDWMIHSLTLLMCPSRTTAVLEGNQPPYKLASELYEEKFNEMLRPVIETPMKELVSEALEESNAESAKKFVVLTTVLKELCPKAIIRFNTDVLLSNDSATPILFYCNDTEIDGLFNEACYGIQLKRQMYAYNGKGVLAVILDWLFLQYLNNNEDCADMANFVYNSTKMSDSNPLIKYI